MTGTQGFAIDYYLNARRQCNYASGGVSNRSYRPCV